MPPEEGDFLCGRWVWDPVLRELRHYARKGKRGEDEPATVERLPPVRSVTWYRWSQPPMQSHTGEVMPTRLSRVVAEYESGGNLTVNEDDRECARKLAGAIAGAYGLPVTEAGAPDGRRGGNLPARDAMGRLVTRSGRTEVALDTAAGEITITLSKRPFGRSRRQLRTTDLRRLELGYEVKGPLETFTVWGVAGPEEEKLPLASYSGYEGWADPEEWRQFTQDLGRSLGVPAGP
ncbi:MAG: hypothetical protein Q7T33_03290 [Dehalococcoidia bacterium]|nr:hypothetical protein [Dehalococcoidia bacterium]